MRPLETRTYTLADVQYRQADADTPGRFTGHAAVFDQLSDDLGGYREKVAPGAFAKTIREADIRFLINHEPNLLLARNRNGTLRLSEDERGLAVDSDMADVSYARDLGTLLERRDIDQMSFMFETIIDEWDEGGDQPVRTLKEVRLWDVSVVTFPAYPQTDAQMRGLLGSLANLDADQYQTLFRELRVGKILSSKNQETIASVISSLQKLLDEAAPLEEDSRTLAFEDAQRRLASLDHYFKIAS